MQELKGLESDVRQIASTEEKVMVCMANSVIRLHVILIHVFNV